jgi:hypothetical protein
MRQVVPVLLLAISACSTPNRSLPEPAVAKPVRFFDEKVRCAAVGERIEAKVCGEGSKRTLMCAGWWAYNPERDTCVGVFVLTHFSGGQPTQIMNVYDLLTGIDVEEPCMAPTCPVEAAKKRWILRGN